ncbi:glutamyl-tRNA reductase [Oceanicoccus sp. KOV_DT_Chl]|uniref:glutamyl-tRNA reductase n=1 Tax=Oceanicoccus sp. KOV_DT_Chl TaxID=1904639 RepID=UPI000C79B3F1|nr:glutamyl-tRNA reductase [Oceanicoccus sp. KOV_DT_Chl]
MALIALGINHKSAQVALRERVAFAPEQMSEALTDAMQDAGVNEVVILSTCNRTEVFAILAVDSVEAEQQLLAWLAGYHHIPLTELNDHYYAYHEQQALHHMIQVTSGLDSMVLGEPQIFGQMKSAFVVAQEAESVGSEFSRIFPHVFSVAKKVRTDTAIGENPVSVAYAAVSLSHHIFSDLSKTRALLVGAGETVELVARHLSENGVNDIVVANRTLGRARELAQRFGAEAVLLSEIPEQLINADIVITSTASQLPILGKGAVEHALKMRKHRPILMVDIAVPRDIEEQVGELDDIYLYTVDDLTEIVDENKRSRESEARKADKIIAAGIENYLQQLKSLNVVETLKQYRSQSEQARDIELEKALKLLAKGDDAEQVLTQLARNLTNKFMHKPSIEMKKASVAGREDLISWAHDLFGLASDEKPNVNDKE